LVLFILLLSSYSDLILTKFGMSHSMILLARLAIEICFSMIIVVLLGEFIPKAIFRAKSDSLLIFSSWSGLLGLFHAIFYPIASMFVKFSRWILTIIFDMRIDEKKETFSRADLEHYFQQTRELDEQNQD